MIIFKVLYVAHLVFSLLASQYCVVVQGRLLSISLTKPDPDDAAATARWLLSRNTWGVLRYISHSLFEFLNCFYFHGSFYRQVDMLLNEFVFVSLCQREFSSCLGVFSVFDSLFVMFVSWLVCFSFWLFYFIGSFKYELMIVMVI